MFRQSSRSSPDQVPACLSKERSPAGRKGAELSGDGDWGGRESKNLIQDLLYILGQ
ncbi:hypothetical protein APLC1_0246 [Limnospira platensis C1]|nr:hypothetical protein APLC1_0246 [Arthrospira platensis C1]